MIDIQVRKKSGKKYRYLIDNGWMTHQGCVARGYKIRLDDIEEQIYRAMCDRIKSLEIARKQKETPDIEIESIKADILRYIVQIDGNELRQIGKLANNIANNINQIAARVNATHNIYKEDIEEIKSLVNQLWKPLLFLQGKILQLKH